MASIKDIKEFFYRWAPNELAAHWDNVGLQIGEPKANVSELLLSLEVDEAVLAYLEHKENVLVITHHPLFFNPIKQIRTDKDLGIILKTFLKNDHYLFSAHTNLDAAEDGVNDCLIKRYGLDPKQGTVIKDGFGKFFDAPKLSFEKAMATMPAINKGAQQKAPIQRLAFCAGSGHGLIQRVIDLGCDTFITGEANYHDEVSCRMNGVRLILLGHKESEEIILADIKEKLLSRFPNEKITNLVQS